MLAGNQVTPLTFTIGFSPPATTQLHRIATILNQHNTQHPFSPVEPITYCKHATRCNPHGSRDSFSPCQGYFN